METILFFPAFILFFFSSGAGRIRIKADLVLYDRDREKVSASGNVKVEWQDVQVTTEEIVFYFYPRIVGSHSLYATLGGDQVQEINSIILSCRTKGG